MTETTFAATANIDALVADYKKNLPGTKFTSIQTAIKVKILSSIVGAEFAGKMGQLADVTMSPVKFVINKIFGSKQAWDSIKAEDKKNLIDSLAIEAIYQKNITDLTVVKNYIYDRIKEAKLITKGDNWSFWDSQSWARDNVSAELKKYNENLFLLNNIIAVTANTVSSYELSKEILTGIQAVNNFKKGKIPTQEEQKAIAIFLDHQKSTEVSISVRKQS